MTQSALEVVAHRMLVITSLYYIFARYTTKFLSPPLRRTWTGQKSHHHHHQTLDSQLSQFNKDCTQSVPTFESVEEKQA